MFTAVAAHGHLTRAADTDLLADGDTVTIGTITYRFKTTIAQAYDITLTASSDAATAAALRSLAKVINGTGTLGTSGAVDGYTGSTKNPYARADVSANGLVLTVTATMPGIAGNLIASTEVITDAQITWGAATLASGTGDPQKDLYDWLATFIASSQLNADCLSDLQGLVNDVTIPALTAAA